MLLMEITGCAAKGLNVNLWHLFMYAYFTLQNHLSMPFLPLMLLYFFIIIWIFPCVIISLLYYVFVSMYYVHLSSKHLYFNVTLYFPLGISKRLSKSSSNRIFRSTAYIIYQAWWKYTFKWSPRCWRYFEGEKHRQN